MNCDNVVVALFVTYNGGKGVLDSIRAVGSQVNQVVVVDNGSSHNTVGVLRELQRNGEINLVCLENNFGIARAQNIGFEAAKSVGARWVLTLDQDSECASDMVARLLSVAVSFKDENLGFVCPEIKSSQDISSGGARDDIKEIDYAISSGCLISMKALDVAGPQCDEYFIDAVDFEYCLRLRANGFRLFRVGGANLYHRLGAARLIRLFGIPFVIRVHAPSRRYYLVRNHVFLTKSYWNFAPSFLLRKSTALILLLFQILLFETGKIENFRQCILGLFDGVAGRGGKSSH